ncbi:MAG: DOMON-like domain-containing protein [Deltaproteobacteria bacterium]|nr:DOMON-like domain-containing protein [Nannocystaceae bacterium]
MTAAPALASFRLRPHPQTPCMLVDELVVQLALTAPGVLTVLYTLRGAIDRLRIPTAAAPLDPERLWANTCCELFIAPAQGDAYVEWNFSPSGQLTRFAFSAYRQRMPSPPPVVATPEVSLLEHELRISARIPLGDDAPLELRIAPTAVVEDAGGSLSYWALRHRPDRPDFHHEAGFALVLTAGLPIAIVQR